MLPCEALVHVLLQGPGLPAVSERRSAIRPLRRVPVGPREVRYDVLWNRGEVRRSRPRPVLPAAHDPVWLGPECELLRDEGGLLQEHLLPAAHALYDGKGEDGVHAVHTQGEEVREHVLHEGAELLQREVLPEEPEVLLRGPLLPQDEHMLRRDLLPQGQEVLRRSLLRRQGGVLRQGLLPKNETVRCRRAIGDTHVLCLRARRSRRRPSGLLPANRHRQERAMLPQELEQLRPVRPAVPSRLLLPGRRVPSDS